MISFKKYYIDTIRAINVGKAHIVLVFMTFVTHPKVIIFASREFSFIAIDCKFSQKSNVSRDVNYKVIPKVFLVQLDLCRLKKVRDLISVCNGATLFT